MEGGVEHNNPRALTGDNVFYDNVRGGAWLKGAWGMDDEELLLFRDSGGDGGGHGLPHLAGFLGRRREVCMVQNVGLYKQTVEFCF